ncbi:MAG: EamA family transporter [Rhodoferax sp.]|nr:EamA family transporter [Rhodoferax sp.]
MHALSRRQLGTLVLLTVIWGLNWPIMKLGVTDFPPLTFRALSMWLSLPVLWLVLRVMGVPLRIAREHWRELFWLTFANMFVWQGLIIVAIKSLSSGRAAILGYTMPIFSAVLGALFFGNKLLPRAWAGVTAAGVGVVLLLWNEFTHLTGSPLGVMEALIAAASWAVGTQMLRRTPLPVATLTLSFWMMVLTTGAMTLLALLFETAQWKTPPAATWAAILFNAVLVFGLAQAAWFSLARGLPPVAATLSVMLIPILGVFSGALWLHEVLQWQDWTAVVLMVVAIGSVLAPAPARKS